MIMPKVYKTAELTAVWRSMGGVDNLSISNVSISGRIIGYFLGLLDPNSVKTICFRTELIDNFIKKLKPKYIVEIGVGYSSRYYRFKGKFKDTCFYNLDLPYFAEKNKNILPKILPYDITKDSLNLDLPPDSDRTLFIVEGVTMYLKKNDVERLLKEIKKYKGFLLIDFFNFEQSTKYKKGIKSDKKISERLYKLIFKFIINKCSLFNYRIKNIEDGKKLLGKFGYKNILNYSYDVPKTLDTLFYAEFG